MLTVEEKATNYDTFRHIERVRNLLNTCIVEILRRGELHDQTKLEKPEVELFTEYTPKLAGSTYGSNEYNGFRQALYARTFLEQCQRLGGNSHDFTFFRPNPRMGGLGVYGV